MKKGIPSRGPDGMERVGHPRKWAALFDSYQDDPENRYMIFTIDYPRLVLVDMMIATIGIGTVLTLRRK